MPQRSIQKQQPSRQLVPSSMERLQRSDRHRKPYVDRNLRVEELRNRATNLSRFDRGIKFRLARVGHVSHKVEMAFRDREMFADLWKAIVAVASSLSGLKPILPSCEETAMAKQPACQRPAVLRCWCLRRFQNRVPNEYCASCRELLSVNIDPLPLLTSPRQTAVALRSISRPFSPTRLLTAFELPRSICVAPARTLNQ